ncbi:Transmembrane protein 192, partial [Tupaia chinensis]
GSLDITQSVDDDPLLDTRLLPHHSLQAHFRPRFHPLPTVIIANLLLFIHVVFVILAFLTGVLCSYPNPNEDKCPGNYTNPLKVQTVIILGKVVLWILHLLLERFIQYQHSKARKRGYSTVYRSTRHLKGLALMVHSSGNTALLLVLCIQHSFPEPARLYLDLLLAILALELLCSLTCLLIYTVRIQKFNRAKPQPDVLEEEKVYAYPSNITSETGFRTISSLEEIVEKQGDIILYLKRHNALLNPGDAAGESQPGGWLPVDAQEAPASQASRQAPLAVHTAVLLQDTAYLEQARRLPSDPALPALQILAQGRSAQPAVSRGFPRLRRDLACGDWWSHRKWAGNGLRMLSEPGERDV